MIDETLRVITFSLAVFREAKKDVQVCGMLQENTSVQLFNSKKVANEINLFFLFLQVTQFLKDGKS